MKISRPKQRVADKTERVFSGKVEVVITPISASGLRMTSRDGVSRRSLRIEETTVDEVYQIIHRAIERSEDK